MDEAALPAGLQMPHQQVVHDTVAKVGGEDLPLLGFGHQKGQGGIGDVGAALQGLVQGQQVGFQIALEGQGIVGMTLAPAALPVGAVEGLQAEQRMPRPQAAGGPGQGRRGDHAPPRTGHTRWVLSLRHRDHRPPIPVRGVRWPARACPPRWRAGRTHHDPTGSPGRSPHSARLWPCPASPDRSWSARRPRPVAVCRSQPSFCLARPTISSATYR